MTEKEIQELKECYGNSKIIAFNTIGKLADECLQLLEEHKKQKQKIHEMCEVASRILRECDWEDAGDNDSPETLYFVPEDWIREILEDQSKCVI